MSRRCAARSKPRVLLAVLLHVVWRKLTLRLGGTDGTYLLSVILYYLLAGGVDDEAAA